MSSCRVHKQLVAAIVEMKMPVQHTFVVWSEQYAALFTADTDTMRSFFAQQDHMQVFHFILDCLDFLST